MPKQTLVLNDFSGGLNNNPDPRDIELNEFSEIKGVQLSEPGLIKFIQGEETSVYASMDSAGTLDSSDVGTGTYTYSADFGLASGSLNPIDIQVFTSSSNGKINIRVDDSVSEKQTINGTGNASSHVFYDANGHLRISDAFLGNSASLWFGYIDTDLFLSSADGTTFQQTRGEWVRTVQDLRPFNNLASTGLGITLALDDMTAANPDSSSITDSTSKIVLAYAKYSQGRGDWTGSFEFGATPVYYGDQEGPITEIPGMAQCYKEKLSFQLYVCKGNSDAVGNNTTSLFVDKRIIGVNIYFRRHGRDSWLLLKEFDCIKGKPHHWAVYNENTDTAKGIWAGSLSVAMTGGQSLEQYVDSSVTVAYNLDASIMDSDRSGFLRVFGFLQNPIYQEIPSGTSSGQFSHTSAQNIVVSVKNPSEGTKEIYCQVLDEELNVVKESAKVNVSFTAGSLTDVDIEGIFNEQSDERS